VKDASGAVVPSAVVTALNTGTGISQSVEIDAVGYFVFPVLPVGTYEITIRHAGFKDYRQTGLTLRTPIAGIAGRASPHGASGYLSHPVK
jgi:hypothetical protein